MLNDLRYFKPSEFREWGPLMHHDMLMRLDEFRHLWGAPVMVSPVSGALGRNDDSGSYHNIKRHGFVMAIDVMIPTMVNRSDRVAAVELAELCGFGGIGLYPDWTPHSGLHLDIGPAGRRWSGIKVEGKQKYFEIERGF